MSRFVLMAGGTAGHLFPALALAQELVRTGHEVHLATDKRVTAYGGDFPASRTHIIAAATPSLRHPVKFVGAGFTIVRGIISAFVMLGRVKPDCVVAFGGYPSFPPFVAASMRSIPGILHEQNAVLGRANRALARFAKVLATHFATTRGAEKFSLDKVVTGNPVRDQVREAAAIPYPEIGATSALDLLIFGGSQGARAFSDLVPKAIAGLPAALKQRLRVTQQCRPEDLERVAKFYAAAHVNVELATFFDDLPYRMARSHLVVARAGASTIAELAVLGRPAILVPLPGSLDQDQRANATIMQQAGGGWLYDEATLSPQSLGKRFEELFADPGRLRTAAANAKKTGRPDAVKKLAKVALRLAERRT